VDSSRGKGLETRAQEELALTAFAYGLSFAFLAAIFLGSGAGHALRFGRFRALIRGHGIVPGFWSGAVARAITAFELGIGGAFLWMLFLPAFNPPEATALAAGSGGAGLAFLLYLRRLLQQPVRTLSCGCSLLAGPLTGASVVPSASLLLVSVVGLVAVHLGGLAAFRMPTEWLVRFLPACWGATLAFLVLVLPAVVAPRTAIERY
jgi:Methylamine utilisation protein MauE